MVKVAAPPPSSASFRDIPELREAYAAERDAVARVVSIEERLPVAKGGVLLAQRDRDTLISRTAREDGVTGADLRKAEEAIHEAEALVTLLTEALPKARAAAKEAGDHRDGIVSKVNSSKVAVLREDYAAANAAATAALAARDRAEKRLREWPPEMVAELEAIHEAHGRDMAAQRVIAELQRQDAIAHSREMHL